MPRITCASVPVGRDAGAAAVAGVVAARVGAGACAAAIAVSSAIANPMVINLTSTSVRPIIYGVYRVERGFTRPASQSASHFVVVSSGFKEASCVR